MDEGSSAEAEAQRAWDGRRKLPSWRWEALRTTLWLVPTILVAVACVLFVATFAIDFAAFHHDLTLPTWIRFETGSPDAGRQVLIAIAAAVITVVGVVFSITILALTLASQQFGPRMMRNFVRDIGNQVTLGIFVATFVYSVLSLASISAPKPDFIPHLSIFVAEALSLLDLAVLIYFIHHIAKSIQLPEVIAGIARDLMHAIDAEFPERKDGSETPAPIGKGRSVEELLQLIDERGVVVPADTSGYLQFVGYAQLVDIAARTDSVIRLNHRPGHFIVAGRPLATVWPGGAAGQVALALSKAHVTGRHRTLMQDPVFAIDQLVEIAIRALSPAVNDTFTALTCIDWLSAGLSRVSGRNLKEAVYRDRFGRVRLIDFDPSYARMVNRAFDKVRQAARGMPAVIIRMIDALINIMDQTLSAEQRRILARQAEMIFRSAQESVPEADDREDIEIRYRRLLSIVALDAQ
ncbi:MAG TPA: DUF2254 domain-containing protein [Acidimicrobiales bacterium]|nr:DUF2254 domain-containing protein [Acidimicrobiales bacterium]